MGASPVPHPLSPDPQDDTNLEELLAMVRGRVSPREVELITRAYNQARNMHGGQKRASGEPYFIHPYKVAMSLAELHADGATIAAALLHDVLEDTTLPAEELKAQFGPEVLHLVEGVTKLGKFSFSSREERQAENFRRMFIAMAQDIRVIIIKLADRQHNMWTLQHLPPEKQREIAKETLEIFAPLAHRLGIARIKWELEDTSLRYLMPEEYQKIAQLVADKRVERERQIAELVAQLDEDLRKHQVKAEISGRPKSFYSIYQKMMKQQKDFSELYDITALRIIVPSEPKCYEVLGIVHNLWKPIPGRFKDYIAMPKPNMYQSLHTAVIGPQGKPVEVQIRTEDMHRVAEFGIAAHWGYKSNVQLGKADDKRLTWWLHQLLEWQADLKDAREFLDTVKEDLFSDEVFVFTPRGDVYDLPRGATPVDFAYRIHTDVGHRCVGAKVNNKIVPIDYKLRNGDRAEIITSKTSHPRLDWLNWVVTSQAKNRIRQWLKKAKREEHLARGRELLENEFGRTNLDNLLKSDRFAEVATKLNYTGPEDLLAAIGYGEVTLNQLIARLRSDLVPPPPAEEEKPAARGRAPARTQTPSGILVDGVGGLLVQVAKCCSPIPGDAITGLVTRGRGIMIHHQDCSNVTQVPAARRTLVSWGDTERATYPVDIQIETF
ncbi:MAG: bifunctional (p)ppGpp synthetase/guanosine-3',5'-bis(diphosphate) 3'-pyrophosphohydrolase, partial [Nevskia sp.]|nr:bifunctional (p)ppGpp synthetase/guanosine-3',5'-bis(diphosphate) 3'-pyrophosphohydrolase [Nevskia sp.]